MSARGGSTGERVWWPAGMESMTPRERVEAFARGWWDIDREETEDGYTATRIYRSGDTEHVHVIHAGAPS